MPPKKQPQLELGQGDQSINIEGDADEGAKLKRNQQKRAAIYKAFDGYYEDLGPILQKTAPSREDQLEVETALQEMKTLFDQASDLNDAIESALEGADYDAEYERMCKRRKQDRKALITVKNFMDESKKSVSEKTAPVNSAATTAKLPKLRLPTFDGTFTKWFAFWETMECDVLQGNFSDITKFNYISGQLRGVAAESVTGIHASGENLDTLCTTLKERFGQPRKIVRSHVLSLFDISSPSHTYAELSRFYNHIMGDIRSLNNLGVKTEECAAFIVPLLERKIPRQFIDKMGTSGQEGDFHLQSFLDTFVLHLNNLGERSSEASGKSDNSKQNRNTGVISAANLVASRGQGIKCPFCEGDHTAVNCTLDDIKRFEVVKKKRLCYNCLRPHSVKLCSNRKNCFRCQARHHTALHNHFAHENASVSAVCSSAWQSKVENSADIFPQVKQGSSTENSADLVPQGLVQNSVSVLQYSADLLPQSLQNSVLQNSAGIAPQSLQQSALQNSADLVPQSLQQSALQNSADLVPQSVQNPVLQNSEAIANLSETQPGAAADVFESESTAPAVESFSESSKTAAHSSKLGKNSSNIVLLETGRVSLVNADRKVHAGVLVDRGSMLSYIRKDTVDKLRLKAHGSRLLNVNGFGGHVSRRSYDLVSVDVITSEGVKPIEVLVTEEIVKPIDQKGWADALKLDYIAGLSLADDFAHDRLNIDLLIGCDNAYHFLENKVITGKSGPSVQFSNLGCFLSGPLHISETHTSCSAAENGDQFIAEDRDRETARLEQILRENILEDSGPSADEESFVQEFIDQIQYKDGQYFAPLPLKRDHPELHNNIEACIKRNSQVMARLGKLGLTSDYFKVMQEYIDQGHTNETGEPLDPNDDGYYMPHFPVLRDSATTPLRIVFDGSFGSPSLNSCLHTGPNLTLDLVDLLHKFRTRKFGVTADIRRAFLAIKLLESQRRLVKFIWYKDNDVTKILVPYQCNTVIFGNVSSPFTLAATLRKHLTQFNTPVTRDILQKTYVDNLISSVDTEADALSYYNEAREAMGLGNFDLRQWATNSNELNKQIEKDETGAKPGLVSTVGLKWDPKSDQMAIAKPRLPFSDSIFTKRSVVSEGSSVFDPMGMVGPMIVPAKAFANKLWVEGKKWDDPLSPEQVNEWKEIQGSLRNVHEIKFPRFLGFEEKKTLDIIIFCDACPNTAIGCVGYGKQDQQIALLGSKNKIVSQKKSNLTVPKLELQAMYMGALYAKTLADTYQDHYAKIEFTFLTDSEIALYWLQSEKKLQPFVKNRVEAIRQLTNVNQWYHVATSDNAADVLSRGTTLTGLLNSHWLQGPQWLTQHSDTWPIRSLSDPPLQVMLAAAAEAGAQFHMPNPGPTANIANIIDVTRFSSYQKLLRVTALTTRAFKKGCGEIITAQEISAAERLWLHSIQQREYPEVLEYLQREKSNQKSLPRRPAIVNQLGLVLGEDGLIRCGGRVRRANVDFDRKFPVLLPNKSYLSTLIIRDAHHRMVHYGIGSTMCELRKKFWITSMRSSVKKVLKRCVVCKIVAGRPYLAPLAPDLPEFRLNDLTPFTSTAVDFTSHIFVKNSAHKIQKVYVALFTCCTTRAVELEVVPDLTVESFLRAFRRFTSSCSVPKLIYCDNAKTFKGSEVEIKRLLANCSSKEVQNHFAKRGIRFKYIPVEGSWFGGVYERLVGVTKNAMKKTLGKALVDYDEFQTLIKEIQQIVNNRPLTYASSDPADLSPITPNHLIYGHDLNILPQTNYDDENDFDPTFMGKTKLEQLAHRRSQLISHFGKRFQDEYLASLRERHRNEIAKQKSYTDAIRVGDVVLIHNKDQKRVNWKLGIVEELHKGQDNLTRSATVRSKTGLSNRAIAKLYPLELNIGCEKGSEKPAETLAVQNTRAKRSAAKMARDRILGLSLED